MSRILTKGVPARFGGRGSFPGMQECAKKLKKRTLTNLYNARPAWLDLAHRRLDDAVCAAYATARGGECSGDMPEEQIPEQLLELNLAAKG